MVEGYEKFIRIDVNFQKTPGSTATTLSKGKLEEPKDICEYRSFLVQFMWYTMNVVPDMEKVERQLSVHIGPHGP